MRSQCVQYVIAEHILILITDHIEVTSPGSFKMWAIFNWWAHCDYFVSVNTMSSQCTCWVFDPLSPVSWTLEMSIPLSDEEGDRLLGSLDPGPSLSPSWECGDDEAPEFA